MKLSDFDRDVLAQLEREDPEEAKAYLEALEEADADARFEELDGGLEF
jgi:hypothetical protein